MYSKYLISDIFQEKKRYELNFFEKIYPPSTYFLPFGSKHLHSLQKFFLTLDPQQSPPVEIIICDI